MPAPNLALPVADADTLHYQSGARGHGAPSPATLVNVRLLPLRTAQRRRQSRRAPSHQSGAHGVALRHRAAWWGGPAVARLMLVAATPADADADGHDQHGTTGVAAAAAAAVACAGANNELSDTTPSWAIEVLWGSTTPHTCRSPRGTTGAQADGGGTVSTLLAAATAAGRPVRPVEVVDEALQVADALAYLHDAPRAQSQSPTTSISPPPPISPPVTCTHGG